jgi:hypothetical protein
MPENAEPLTSRDIWSYGGGRQLPGFLASALSTLILLGPGARPAYFSSPWMSNFDLFDNRFGAFASLFPDLADKPFIKFSDYLVRLARRCEVRIITTQTETSIAFVEILRQENSNGLFWRFADDEYHEKGILGPQFYIDGSMNITYSGVFIRGEKLTYYTAATPSGRAKIATAYVEFDRRWTILI